MNASSIHQFDLLLDGRSVPAKCGKYYECVNPSNAEVFARLADADHEDIEIAVQSARLAFDFGQWPKMGMVERGKYLMKVGALIRTHAKELADIESASTGKTLKHTTFIDVPTCAQTFEYFALLSNNLNEEVIKVNDPILSTIHREPMGVVVAIIPSNYPLIMTAWKLAPALMAGNTIILKPSPQGSVSVMALAHILPQVGFPKGVLNIISSSRVESGALLTTHAQVDMVSFTGSTKTGCAVMTQAAQGIKKITLELGGKSPNIVFADCNFDAALGGALSAIFMNGGQMCTAGSRLLVEDKIYDQFVTQLIKRTKELKIGPANNFETEFGPLMSVSDRDKVLEWISKGLAEGATLACGGKIPPDVNVKGAYLEPTIFTNVRNSMKIAQEEIFGPVLCVMKFRTLEEAVQIANDTKYGLAAMIWTEDLIKANKVAKYLQCATVWINTYGAFLNEAPFGGYKQSGIGCELGKEGLLEYTRIKHIALDQTPGGKSLVTSWF